MRWWMMAIMALALAACNYQEVEREIGYKGKARVNPWLAAERFIGRMGWKTQSVISWTAPEWSDSVWLVPASTLSNESFNQQTERWVRDGGHLILLVEKADAESNDWHGRYPEPVLETPLLRMLKRAGIELIPGGSGNGQTAKEIEFEGAKFQVDASSSAAVKTSGGEAGVFVSKPVGRGRVTVLTDGRVFRNRWIDQDDHAALLSALINASPFDGTVSFMRGSGVSLWSLLNEHLAPVLIGLAVLVGLWLWKNLSRFGPIESAAVPQVLRGYEHHLEALGDFQWRLDHGASLLAPLREQVVELGQRVSVRAGRRDDDFFQFLAERAGLPRERVFRALAEAAPADSAILTRTTADLQTLLQVLQSHAMS